MILSHSSRVTVHATLGAIVLAAWPLLAQSVDLPLLERLHAQNPRDAIVLFNLAAMHAARGERAQTLSLLDEMSRVPGGLDPGAYGGFAPLRDDPTFGQLLDRIHAAHPPRVRSTPAYTIAERDLRPEGMAFDPAARAVFAGSYKGKIIRVGPDGAATEFARVSRPGQSLIVLGLRVDTRRRQLWAVVDDPRAFSDAAAGGSALHQYDLASGRLVARFVGPAYGALNDVAVGNDGVAYATNTSDGSVWKAVPGASAVTPFLAPGSVLEANGLDLSPDGRYLFVAGWHEVVRVDTRTAELLPLAAPAEVPTGNFDGLYWHRGGLVGIQNGVHPGRVLRLSLDASRSRVRRVDVLEAYHPLHAGVTTGAIDGNALLYFANTQSRAFGPDGAVRPGVALRDIVILRLPLP